MTKEDKEIIEAIKAVSLDEFKQLIKNVCKKASNETK